MPTIAGAVSTVIFVVSTMPMLLKAFRTKDLSSYSLGNIATANVGNLVQSIYVLSLPVGPIWVLHGFYVVATSLMLFWYLKYRVKTPSLLPRDSARLHERRHEPSELEAA